MVCIGISNEKAKIYLSYNKFVIETMDNEPIDTIDLSAKYVRVNNLSINGDISNEQLFELDASMIQIFNQAYDDDQSFCNLDVACDFSLAGTFFGPETLIIDPMSHGDNSGTVIIRGNLQVLGDHTFINSQTIEVSDNIIRMHANYNALDFGGIEVVDDSGVVRQFLWSNIEDRWILEDRLFLNDDLDVSNNVNISGDLVVDGNFDLSGRIDVDNDASFNGNVDISNHLTVNGDASLNGDVDISGTLKADTILLGDILKGIGRFILLDACGNLVDSSFISFDGSSVIIDTSAGLRIPAGTTDERPAPALQGHIRYNSTLDSFEGYDGTNWGKLGGLKDVDGDTYISVETSAGDDNDDLDFYTAGVRYLQIDNSGNILIGKGDNLSKFTISGETGNTQIAGTVEISGNPGGVGLTVHNDISTNNIYMHQFIYGNEIMYIDPVHPTADNSGLLVIRADVQILGTQTTINSTTTEVSHNIIVHIPAALTDGGLKVKDQNDHLRPFVFKNAPDFRWDLSDAIIFRDYASFGNNVDISENLYVNGDVSFQRNLDVSGRLTTTNLTVIGDVSFNGNVDISDRLVTYGDVSLISVVDISGKLNVKDTGTFLGNGQGLVVVNDSSMNGDLYLGGILYTENNFIIDPKGHGDNTGLVIIRGGLQVDGSSTTINSTIVDISDHRILLSSNSTHQSQTDGAGIEVSNNKLFIYDYANDRWLTNIGLNVSGDLIVEEDVSLNNALDISGKFNINGDSSFNAPVDINNDFNVNSDSSFNANVYIQEHLKIDKTLTVIQDASFSQNVIINETLQVDGVVTLNNNVDISENLYVNGDVSFQRNLDVSGTLMASTIKVLGDVSFDGFVDISDRLVAYGDASFNQDVDISGILHGNDLIINGDASFNQNVDISDQLNVNGDASLNSSVDISDRLVVNGDASFNQDVDICGILHGNKLIINDDASFNNNVDISENLYVNGDVSFQRNLDVSGQLIATTIKVLGDVSFNGNVDVSDRLLVYGDVSLNGNVDVSDRLVVEGNVSLNKNVDISNQLNVNGDASFNSIVDISNRLNVDGIAFDGLRQHLNVLNNENSLIVAVGTSTSKIAYSKDFGNNWTEITATSTLFTNGADGGQSVEFNGSMWVAAGRGGNHVAYSYDGINWNSGGTVFSHSGRDIKYDNYRGRWILVGQGNSTTIAYSYDGINWTTLAVNPIQEKIMALDLNETDYVVCGETTAGAPTLAHSYDLINWTTVGVNPFERGRCVLWSGERWLAGGVKGDRDYSLVFSDDGITWNDIGNADNLAQGSTNIFSTSCVEIATNGSTIIAVGQGTNTIAYSKDGGLTFTGLGTSIIGSGFSVAWCGTQWVVGGNNSEMAVSRDGIVWTSVTSPFTSTTFDIAWNRSIYNSLVDINERLNTMETKIDVSYRNVDISLNLLVEGDASFNQNVDISGILKVTDLQVLCDASFNNNVDISENLYVNGDVSFQRNLDVSGSITATTIKVLGDVSFDGFVDISDRLVAYGDASFNQDVDICGMLHGNKLIINSDASFNNRVDISNHLQVLGDTSLNNKVDISDNLYVNGDVSFQRNLDVSGKIVATTLKVLGDASFNQNVDISGILKVAELEVLGDASFNNNVDISENLYVNGDVSFQRNLDVSGSITATTIKVLGDISFDGFVDISDRLLVYGDASFNQDVDICGILYGNKLIINNDASFNNRVDISNHLQVLGDVSLNNKVDISDNLYVNGDVSFQRNLDVSGKLFVTTLESLDVSFRNVDISENLSVSGDTILSTLRVIDLTETRILFVGSSGELIDSSFLTFDGSNLIIDTSSSIQIPVGTTDERPNPAIKGQIRYNITDSTFEGYDGDNWGSLGGVKDVDGDTYILAESGPGTDNDELEFYTAGTKYMTIDGCGNIIVGSNMFTISAETGYTLFAGDVSMNKNVDISENLYVNGDVSFQRNLDVSGTITATTIKVFGDVSFDGFVDISDRLVVYGDVSFNQDVDICGILHGNKLIINGDASFNSNLDISDQLNVNGDVSLNSSVDISENLKVNGDVSLNSNVDISNNLYVNGDVSFQRNLDVSGQLIATTLKVLGDVSFDGFVDISENLYVNGDVSFQKNLDISGKIVVTTLNVLSDTSLNGNIDISENLYVNGDVSFQRNLDVSGQLIATSLKVLGDVSFNGNVDISDRLVVYEDASFNKNVEIAETLNTGRTDISNTLIVKGDVSLNSSVDICNRLVVNGDISFNSNLDISDQLNVLGDVSLNKNVDISENLYVNGDVSFQRNLDVSGEIVATTLKVLGDVSFNGNVDISDRLVVNGDVSLNGNVDISDRLVTNGDVSLNSNVDITNKLVVDGDASFNSNVDISNRLNVNDIAFDGIRKDINVLNGENNLLVAIGSDNTTGDSNRIIYSHDLGDTWFSVPSSSSIFTETNIAGTGVAYNGSMWVASGRGTNHVAYSYDGINWNGAGQIFSHSGRVVKYDSNKGRWIVGGQGSSDTLVYSYDGINWKGLGNTAISSKVMGLDLNNTRYVACGEGTSALVYSDDLITWTSISPSPFQRGRCVLWTGRRWLAGGSKGSGNSSLVYSDDGETWIDVSNANNLAQGSSSVFSTVVNKIASNGSTIVAVGKGVNTIAYSKDHGETFAGLGTLYLTIEGFAVEWSGTHFIAGGTGNEMFKSKDGINWTAIATPVLLSTNDITWNKSIYGSLVQLREDLTELENKIDVSYRYVDISLDLLVEGDVSFQNNLDICGNLLVDGYSFDGVRSATEYLHNNENIVIGVGGNTNTIGYSFDYGITWNTVPGSADLIGGSSHNPGATAIAYNGHRWVVIGNGINIALYSDDGLNWTGYNSTNPGIEGPFGIRGWCIKWNPKLGRFIASGHSMSGDLSNNNLAMTEDGSEWIPLGKPMASKTESFDFNPYGRYVYVGSGGTNSIAYSDDFTTYTKLGNSIFSVGRKVLWIGGSRWVAVGKPGTCAIALSDTNGETWYDVSNADDLTLGSSSLFTDCVALGWNGSRLLAGGDGSNRIAYSDDLGLTWKIVSGPETIFTSQINCLVWCGVRWLAGGATPNRLAYSDDNGLTWTAVENASQTFSSQVMDIAWNKNFNAALANAATKINTSIDVSYRNVDISLNLLVEGRVDVSGDVSLNYNVDILNKLSVLGDTSLNENVDITKKLTVGGTTILRSGTTIESTLDVSDTATFVGSGKGVIIENDLSVNNHIHMGSHLYGPPILYIDPVHPTADNSGLLVIRADLQVLGTQTTINSVTTEVSSNIIVHIPSALSEGGLQVKDENDVLHGFVFKNSPHFKWDLSDSILFRSDASFNEDVDICGTLRINDMIVNGDVSFLGYVDISENLYVNGDVSFQRNLDVSGIIRANDVSCDDFNATRIKVEDERVAIGLKAGLISQGTDAIGIGHLAGQNTQGSNAIALGEQSGQLRQGANSITIGGFAGYVDQLQNSIAIGSSAGRNNQNRECIAIGYYAGSDDQGSNSIAIGHQAGVSNQGTDAIAIGRLAGLTNQGSYAIAIGAVANVTDQKEHTIIISAAGMNNATDFSNALYINPIRNVHNSYLLQYNSTTKEITYSKTLDIDKLKVLDISCENIDVSLNLLVEGRVDISGDVSLNSSVDISDRLLVSGVVSMNSNVDISDNLYVNGDVSFQRNLDVSGRLLVDGNSFAGLRQNLNVLNNQDNIIVALGDVGSGTIAYSFDLGETWSLVPDSDSIFSLWGFTLDYNGSIWVAGGRGGNNVAYSYDGINWSAGGTPFVHSGRNIKYNSYLGYWVAGGQGGEDLEFSYDGINWTPHPGGNIDGVTSIRGYHFNETRHVISTTGTNTLLYSDDLINWNVIDSQTFYQNGRTVLWTGRRWISGGSKGTGAGTIFYSDDGISWFDASNASSLTQTSETVFSTTCNKMAYNGTMIVAVGNGTNSIAYSSDHGLSFTGISITGMPTGFAVEWCGTRWIVGGNTNQMYLSNDGINWTQVVNPPFNSICYEVKWNRSIYGIIQNISENISELQNKIDVSYRYVDISLNLLVEGDTSLNGKVDISENLYVNGDVSFQRNLDVSAKLFATTFEAMDVSFRNVDISNRLFVEGDSSFNNFVDISNLRVGHGYGKTNGDPSTKLSSASQTLLGNIQLGQVGYDDWVGFRHNNLSGTSRYAIMQSNAGSTVVNAVSGQNLNFNIANSTKMRLASNGNFGIGVNNPSSILEVNGDSSFNGKVDISDKFNINGDTSFNNNVDISENLYVNGDVSFQRNLDVSGKLFATTFEALDVSFRNVDISNKLIVEGNADFNGYTRLYNYVEASNLLVGAVVTSGDFAGIKNKNVGSNLGYALIQNSNGKTIINSASPESIEFRTSASLMAIFKARKFGLGTNNPTSLLTISGDTSLNGFVDISENLYVNGDVSFQRNLDVSGQLTATSLRVLGDVSFNGFVDISENLYVNGDVSFQRSLDVSGLFTGSDVSCDDFRATRIKATSNGSIAIGPTAGQISQGIATIAIGTSAGQSSADNAISIGIQAGQTSQSLRAIAIGASAGNDSQSNSAIAIGVNSGKTSQGTNSIAIGQMAGETSQGENSVAIGYLAGRRNLLSTQKTITLNATGTTLPCDISNAFFVKPIRNSDNSYILQYDTGSGEITYSNNMAELIGLNDLSDVIFNMTTQSLKIGDISKVSLSNAFYNTFTGFASGNEILTGEKNSGYGYQSLFSLSQGDFNSGYGSGSLMNLTQAESNTGLGYDTLKGTASGMTGSYNTAIGKNSMLVNASGNSNVAVGIKSLFRNSDGSNNVVLGGNSMPNNTTGSYNIGIGTNAGRTTTTGKYNIFIGFDTVGLENSNSNEIVIGSQSNGDNANRNTGHGSNTTTLGNPQITNTIIYGLIEISNLLVEGDASFNKAVHMNGDVSLNSNVDISGKLNVYADSSFNQSVDISNHLVVNQTRFSSVKYTRDVVDSNTNFMVAIGGGSGESNNKLAYSYDGITWTGVTGSTSLFTGFGQSVATNGSTWVAVGNGGNAYAYSYDGITWTGLGSTISPYGINRAFSVKWINELGKYFMGVHGGTQFAYSYDGINWGWQASSSPIGSKMTDFDYNHSNSRFVAVGEGSNTMAYSDDGITWTSLGNTILSRGIGVTSNDKIWVATGQKDSLTSTIVYSEDNGVTWFDASNASDLTQGSGTIFTTRANQAAWNGDMWVVVGGGTNSIAHSNDGKNWTGLGIIMFGEGKGVSWTGSKWVALGSVNRIAYSYDGINWIAVSNSTDIFSSFGARLAWKKNVYPSISHLSSRINDLSAVLAGGSYAIQADFEDLSENVLDLSTNYYEFKNDFIDLSLTVEDLSENLLRRYEDSSFGTVEIRDNLILTDLSLTNLDISNKLLVGVSTDISAVIGRAQIGQVGFNGWAGFKNENLIENNQYALLQSSAGKTLLNADADQDLRLRLDNLDYVTLKSNLITIGRLSTTNYNVVLNADVSMVTNASVEGDFSVNRIESDLIAKTDNTYSLGSITNEWKDLFVGGGSIYMDKCKIMHRLSSNNTLVIDNSGLGLDISHISHVNFRPDVTFYGNVGISGSLIAEGLDILDVSFRNVDISNRLFVEGDSSFNNFVDISNLTVGANKTHSTTFLGKAAIGFIGNNDNNINHALFAHKDYYNLNSGYALKQNNDGSTHLNAASGNHITFRVANTAKMRLLSSGDFGIGLTDPIARLHISGGGVIAEEDSSFNKNLMISGEIITSAGYGGISGEILTSTGSGWKWNTLMLNDLSDAIVDITDFSNSIKIGSNKTGTLNNAYGNTLIGWESGDSITSAFNNTALGFQTLNALAGGDVNVAIGNGALRKLVSGDANVAIGNNSMQNNLNGAYNAGLGAGSLITLTNGYNNVGLGRNAGDGITTGDNNIFLGYQAVPGINVSDSQNQIVIGYDISGKGNNTVLLGNNDTIDTYLKGRVDMTDICGAVVVHDLTTVNDTSTKIATTGAIRRYVKEAIPVYNSSKIQTDDKLNNKIALSFPRDNRVVIRENEVFADLDNKTAGAQEFTFGESTNDFYIAVGRGTTNKILYSYDGYKWLAGPDATNIFSVRGYSVDYDGLKYIAVGQSSSHTMAVSIDGINWNGLNKPLNIDKGLIIKYENGIWIYGGEDTGGDNMAYSFEGTTWHHCYTSAGGAISTIFDKMCNGLAYNGLVWVASGIHDSGTHSLAYSEDGIRWTGLGNSVFSTQGNVVASNGEVFLAGGQGTNVLARSINGINWTPVTVGINIKVSAIACNGKTWVVGGNAGSFLAYSTDNGYTFTNITQNIITSFIHGLYWSGRYFFVSGEGTNALAISKDGINWKKLSDHSFDVKGGNVVCNNRKRNQIKFEKRMSIICGEGTNSLAYETLTYDISNMGLTYTDVSGSTDIFDSGAYAVAHDGKMWVAAGIGTNYSLAYSDNGTVWHGIPHSKDQLFTDGAEGIAYNGKMWVATGNNYASADMSNIVTAYSTDGLCWVPVKSSTRIMTKGFCVEWGEDVWLLGGHKTLDANFTGLSTMAYSYNGIDWEYVSGPQVATNVQDIKWNGKIFVAVGNGATHTIAWSSNGTNWHGCGDDEFTTAGRGIAYSDKLNIWVAVGNGGNTIAYSTDAINWTGVGTSIFSSVGYGIHYNGERFVAYGQGTNTIAYSDDGINWTGLGSSLFTTQGWNGTVSNQYGCVTIVNPVVATGEDSAHASVNYSIDGFKWGLIGRNLFQTNGWFVAYNGIMWVSVGQGNNNTIGYSYDGINWVGLGNSLFTTRGLTVAWNGSYWIVGGRGTNQIAISYDGITWTPVNEPFTTECKSVCWTGEKWIALGSGTHKVATSTDGLNWTGRGNSVFGGAVNAVASNGLITVGTGASGKMAYTFNGENWTNIASTPFSNHVYGIATNGKIWVAVGRGGNTFAYSYDGIVWTGAGSPISSRAYGVAWNGRYWIAVGRGNPCAVISYDGINWLPVEDSNNVPFLTQGLAISSLSKPIGHDGLKNEFVLNKYGPVLSNTMIVTGPSYYADYETDGYSSFNINVKGVKDQN